MIIAIDGPAGTGKSTVAKEVARRLGFAFFDTGAMYRSFALRALKHQKNPSDFEELKSLLPDFHVDIRLDAKGNPSYHMDGEEITQAIRTPQISSAASQVAVFPEVRAALVPIQRAFGRRQNTVFEGRDMGTVVFPDAELKIFLTARAEVRAERRHKELLSKFPDLAETLSFQTLLEEMRERDKTDTHRKVSPLKQAEDAILIDTSSCTAAQVIEKILSLHEKVRKKKRKMAPFYKCILTLVRAYFRLFYRLEVNGVEHLKKGAGILISNHASFFDPPVLAISCPEEIHFLGKASLFRIPLFASLIRALNTHPVHKGASDAATFRQMVDLLSQGKKMLLFPEGNRTFDGRLQPLQRGLAFLAQKAKVPIFPAYIEGTFQVWPRTRWIPRLFGKIRCTFGPPLYWEEFASLPKEEAAKRILERADEALKKLSRKNSSS